MEKEKRKIIYQDGSYQLLKPRDDKVDGWHTYGKKKSLKAIYDLIRSEKYDLEISKDVLRALREYEKKKKRSLASKVI